MGDRMFQKMRRDDLISKVLKVKEEDRKLGKENILVEMKNLNSLQKRVLELNQKFSFVDFLMGCSEVETAIGIITPQQSLFLECELVDNDQHAYNFQALYDAIYDSKPIILPFKSTKTWQELVMSDGNIAIQLTRFGDFYLWCPNTINSYQLNSLRKIHDKFKSIQIMNSGLFQFLLLDIHAWVVGDEGKDISVELENSSLDNLLEYYEDSCKKKKYLNSH